MAKFDMEKEKRLDECDEALSSKIDIAVEEFRESTRAIYGQADEKKSIRRAIRVLRHQIECLMDDIQDIEIAAIVAAERATGALELSEEDCQKMAEDRGD